MSRSVRVGSVIFKQPGMTQSNRRNCRATRRLATENGSRVSIPVSNNFGHGKGRGRLSENFPLI